MGRALETMRRILVGAAWFLFLWIGSGALLGGIVGAIAGFEAAPPHGTFHDGAMAGLAAGQRAGIAFRRAWGGTIFLAALVIAAVGTWRGRLPGTAPAKRPTVVDLVRSPIASR